MIKLPQVTMQIWQLLQSEHGGGGPRQKEQNTLEGTTKLEKVKQKMGHNRNIKQAIAKFRVLQYFFPFKEWEEEE